MSTQRNRRGAARSAASHTAGFTLIELMIAMILGLIVIAGVTSVFLAGQKSFRTNNALADVQDGSRIAFELMARDIRQAGLTGCNSANNRVVNVLANGPGNPANNPTPWWADWNNAVHGYDDASTDPALSGLTGLGAPVAGTDSLELISSSDAAYGIAVDVAGTGFKISTTTYDLNIGDIIIACSPDHAAIMQITGQNASNVEVNYNTGSSVKPGNCSNNLGYPNTNCSGNSPQYTFPPNSKIARLSAVDWYIGTNPENGRSLYRVSLQNAGGNVNTTTQEMIRNVTGMTITYLNPSLAAPLGSAFQTAATITANNGWAGVTAVQVQLQLQSTFQRASVNGNAPLQRTYAFTTTLRNRVN